MPNLQLVEATIADLRRALEAGTVTSVELVGAYLRRIAHYDRHGIALNAVPVLNPAMFEEAAASDLRRRNGATLGPLDGIPYTAKDSYKVKGLTVAAGSPAFEHLVANEDAFTIARLRAGGAVLIGLTNMPPMANGGMQRGVYGRAESPYNADYLTAAFASGSSNGSGTATAASFAAFGLGEETWSSGRAPASNNALVAYTPSRGVISVRGNWPLVPTMDVVVPHTRGIADMLELLDVIVADDAETRGDFWRVQPWVSIAKSADLRPPSYTTLALEGSLQGKRLGVPKMYIGRDSGAERPIETRASVLDLWRQAARDLEKLGAEVVEVDFPVVSNYERDRPGTKTMVERGLVPEAFAEREIWDLCIWGWDDFLRANADPAIPDLAAVDGPKIFPQPPGALPDRYGDDGFDLADYVTRAKQGVTPLLDIPTLAEGLKGLEATRRIDFEDWLDANRLDAVVLPAVADVGPADADVNETSAAIAWCNGTWVANGNLVWRHLGIPTVTVPMGTMADIGMPVGLTFAGKAYDDAELLRLAGDYERATQRRTAPPRTPALVGDVFAERGDLRVGAAPPPALRLVAETRQQGDHAEILVTVELDADTADLKVHVNGEAIVMERSGPSFHGRILVPAGEHERMHSVWRGAYGSIVTAVIRLEDGRTAGAYVVAGGIG
ncbi:amidase [Mesorhizobium sp. LNJC403B00]|uniref:amidase n=1 Tax=Mesorhizobium sp. LNJC403B00 TaxID=1287280 RepID=UPI0003CE4366|nr:amidase [Mesorhizobium sp. LNJC403B00]ESX92160.1 amidase [Mesorhizobium sp. LNJC403B00]